MFLKMINVPWYCLWPKRLQIWSGQDFRRASSSDGTMWCVCAPVSQTGGGTEHTHTLRLAARCRSGQADAHGWASIKMEGGDQGGVRACAQTGRAADSQMKETCLWRLNSNYDLRWDYCKVKISCRGITLMTAAVNVLDVPVCVWVGVCLICVRVCQFV